MKILGANKTHAVIQVTKKELDAISTALMEWQEIEDTTQEPDISFRLTFDRLWSAVGKFKLAQLEKAGLLEEIEQPRLNKP